LHNPKHITLYYSSLMVRVAYDMVEFLVYTNAEALCNANYTFFSRYPSTAVDPQLATSISDLMFNINVPKV